MIRSTWALPALIGATTLSGLVLALTGDGWRDAAATSAIAAPVVAAIWAWTRRA